jgi:2-amino-4-hydroxy-6-hydroxymethyldihydropteridine diphosphokinase
LNVLRTHPITAYVGLGSNLGDRRSNIETAVEQLRLTGGTNVTAISSLLENPAVGGPANSPPFLNAVVELQTTLAAHALMDRLLEIETNLGRQRRAKWEPRVIDLDLLLYGDHVISSQELVVPHPLMHERRFVLQPMAEIAPQVIHPMLQMTVRGLLTALK